MKDNHKKSTFIRAIGLVFLALVFVTLVYSLLRKGVFSSRMGINLAVVGNDRVGVLLLRPDEDLISWLVLPKNLKIKIDKSPAFYPVGSLWDYGVLEKKPFEVVEKSLGRSMGVIVARTMKTNNEVSIEDTLASLHKLSLRTDLSIRDRYLIRQFLSESAKSRKILELEIPESAFDKVTEPDGQEFLVFNSVMSLWTKNKFTFEGILAENVDISINNLTDQSGLGTQLARQLESAGARVIEVKSDHANNIIGRGCLFYSFEEYSQIEFVLTSQLDCVRATESDNIFSNKGISIWLKD